MPQSKTLAFKCSACIRRTSRICSDIPKRMIILTLHPCTICRVRVHSGVGWWALTRQLAGGLPPVILHASPSMSAMQTGGLAVSNYNTKCQS